MRFRCQNKKCQYEFNFYDDGIPNNKTPGYCPVCGKPGAKQVTPPLSLNTRSQTLKRLTCGERCAEISSLKDYDMSKTEEQFIKETGNRMPLSNGFDKVCFYQKHIEWLEGKLETSHNNRLSGSGVPSPKSRLICDDCCNSCRSDTFITTCMSYEQS
jgi:hypothetical protein